MWSGHNNKVLDVPRPLHKDVAARQFPGRRLDATFSFLNRKLGRSWAGLATLDI